jgi:tetratricopeptide (TPR) repeat protein
LSRVLFKPWGRCVFDDVHSGAGLAVWLGRLRIVFRPSAAALSLALNDPHLRNLNQWYRRWAGHRKIDHLVLVENEATYGVVTVVRPNSGDPGLSQDAIFVDADHGSIAKPANRVDAIYVLIRDFIEREVTVYESPEEIKIDVVRDDTQAIRKNVDLLTAELSMSNAQREVLVAELAKIKAKFGGTVDLVSGFLETMVGRKVEPEQFPATLFKIAGDWKVAGEKINALSFSGNLSPRLSALRDKAKAAHRAGSLDEAEELLAEIAHEEINALKRLEDDEREVREEIRLRKQGVAETKAAQAAVAHARLNYREAAALYAEASRIVEAVDVAAARDYLHSQANTLVTLGEQFGDYQALQEAIQLFKSIIPVTSKAVDPIRWVAARVDLGNALLGLGERESGTQKLEQAVAVYREVLGEITRKSMPRNWAITQNNLGNTLVSLAERESGTGRLEQAVAAFREASKEWTRGRFPLDWADTQLGLGGALSSLGKREGDTGKLKEAATACRNALKEFTREGTPQRWSMTQNNLGTVLLSLSERESGTRILEEAVAAFREALKERTRERFPLVWAGMQMNLGNALLSLSHHESGTRILEEAVAAFREALKELTRERFPREWATIQKNLGHALLRLGGHKNETRRLEEAVTAYREALKEYTREHFPREWATIQTNLGNAFSFLGSLEKASGGGLSRSVEGVHSRAVSARLGDDTNQSWHCAHDA